MRMRSRHRGVTLVELVVAITIVAIAVTTILGAFAAVATRSADAMMQQQAIAIAESYLSEILQRWVVDPNDPNGTLPNTGRASWDRVDQYNALVEAPHDQFGNPIASLSSYSVSVSTSQSALAGVPAAAARRIDITVSYAPSASVILSGYRTSY
jgi:MSHA pilin protein MshD